MKNLNILSMLSIGTVLFSLPSALISKEKGFVSQRELASRFNDIIHWQSSYYKFEVAVFAQDRKKIERRLLQEAMADFKVSYQIGVFCENGSGPQNDRMIPTAPPSDSILPDSDARVWKSQVSKYDVRNTISGGVAAVEEELEPLSEFVRQHQPCDRADFAIRLTVKHPELAPQGRDIILPVGEIELRREAKPPIALSKGINIRVKTDFLLTH